MKGLARAFAVLLSAYAIPLHAQDRIRIRIGEDVSPQHLRFREFFPDHDWGTYRNRYRYDGRGNSIYVNNGRFSVWYSEPYTRQVYSPWQQAQPQSTILSEDIGRSLIEGFFERAKICYIPDVRLKLGNNRVKMIDFMADINGWVPVEYVPDNAVLPIYQQDKNVYDANHSKKYILLPPSTKKTLEQLLMNGFIENKY